LQALQEKQYLNSKFVFITIDIISLSAHDFLLTLPVDYRL